MNAASAPDLDRARRLVRRSGTAGTLVTVRVPTGQPAISVGRWYVALLRRLGYPARLAVRSATNYYTRATYQAGRADQMGWSGWIADAPLPFYMLEPPFSCRRRLGAQPVGLWANPSHYCSHRLDAAMRRAHALDTTDPAAGSRLWARIDHSLISSATVIPLFTDLETTVTSDRVRDFQVNLTLGPLLAQSSLICTGHRHRC
jgi:peptide/nickel transport system substrate-binding protein